MSISIVVGKQCVKVNSMLYIDRRRHATASKRRTCPQIVDVKTALLGRVEIKVVGIIQDIKMYDNLGAPQSCRQPLQPQSLCTLTRLAQALPLQL